jgi:hypothetical protein
MGFLTNTRRGIAQDLKGFLGRAERFLPASIRRLYCAHPNLFVPVYPMIGPAPYKLCPDCGHKAEITREEYADPGSLTLRPAAATVVDMTGNLDRR